MLVTQLISPPNEEISILFDLAQAGDMRNIQKQATRIETLDKSFKAFAQTIHRLATNYEDEKILNLLKEIKEENK